MPSARSRASAGSAPGAATAGPGLDPAQARERALGIASLGHAVFRRLSELPVPSFAFINGVALGGGLEVALHCTYRTISAGAGMVAFPECFLGLVPGWGGAIAVGHPLASSGVRLMIQLAAQLAEHPEVRYGLTTMCVGMGMGGTVLWERI